MTRTVWPLTSLCRGRTASRAVASTSTANSIRLNRTFLPSRFPYMATAGHQNGLLWRGRPIEPCWNLPRRVPARFATCQDLRTSSLRRSLSVHLEVTNQAATALPLGSVFTLGCPGHPTRDCRRRRKQSGWKTSVTSRPARSRQASVRSGTSILPRLLPDGWINNGFDGWNGAALIEWPSRGSRSRSSASDVLRTYILYSPGRDASFFCFEPVSHVVDAHNLPGGPKANGLAILAPNEKAEIGCRFSPRLDVRE